MNLSRRRFLASASGLVAASALPAFSKDDPSYWDKRGGFERISLAYQHVHIGLEKPFSILHISDSHITEADERDGEDKQRFAESRRRTFGGRQQSALLSSLDWAKSNVDYVEGAPDRSVHARAVSDGRNTDGLEQILEVFKEEILRNACDTRAGR